MVLGAKNRVQSCMKTTKRYLLTWGAHGQSICAAMLHHALRSTHNEGLRRRVLQPKQGEQQWGTLAAAVRLGEGASIGAGSWTSAHGGAVESVLDEATAELAKMEWATMVSTIEVSKRDRRSASSSHVSTSRPGWLLS